MKYKEAQIHGEVDFRRHVERLVAHERHRSIAERLKAPGPTGEGSEVDGKSWAKVSKIIKIVVILSPGFIHLFWKAFR